MNQEVAKKAIIKSQWKFNVYVWFDFNLNKTLKADSKESCNGKMTAGENGAGIRIGYVRQPNILGSLNLTSIACHHA